MKKKTQQLTITFSLIAMIVGSLTGFGVWKLQNQTVAQNNPGTNSGEIVSQVAGDNVQAGDVFGSPNAEDFIDSAEGYLEVGGIDGEGSHSLLRPGGVSQTVYLTSSVTDLDKFEGMEVKIWGETQKGQKAGWLMDVGRVEVVTVEGTSPAAE